MAKRGIGVIQRLKVIDAARLLQMSPTTVESGLKQGVFPWGYAIKTSEKHWTYFINAKRFAKIEMIEYNDLPTYQKRTNTQ